MSFSLSTPYPPCWHRRKPHRRCAPRRGFPKVTPFRAAGAGMETEPSGLQVKPTKVASNVAHQDVLACNARPSFPEFGGKDASNVAHKVVIACNSRAPFLTRTALHCLVFPCFGKFTLQPWRMRRRIRREDASNVAHKVVVACNSRPVFHPYGSPLPRVSLLCKFTLQPWRMRRKRCFSPCKYNGGTLAKFLN